MGRKLIGSKKHSSIIWECRCDCGNITKATTAWLTTGNVKSCGCLRKETIRSKRKWSSQRARSLGTLYNITPEEYDTIVKFQGGVCPISLKKSSRFVVDHDHSTGKIRGVIDWKINRALAHFNDDPDLLRRAAEYLENPTAEKALGETVYGVIGKITRKAKNRRYGPESTKTPQPRNLNTQGR